MQQQRYWQYLLQTTAHAKYLHYYQACSEEAERRIAIFAAVASSASIAGWAIWQQFSAVWATAIASSQVLSAVGAHLPYAKRAEVLREAAAAFKSLAMRAESYWMRVAGGSRTEQEINDLIFAFQKEQLELENRIFAKVTLIENQPLLQKAEEETQRYFSLFYEQSSAAIE